MERPKSTTPVTNLIVPLKIHSLNPGPQTASITFDANLKRQYYENAHLDFRYSDVASLRMIHMPVYAALRMVGGHWKEVYDQDERFQQIGAVTSDPTWTVSPKDQRLLETAVINAAIEMQFFSFVEAVWKRYLDSHDVVLEIFGKSFVQDGFPKTQDGIRQYGVVDFELIRFEAVYIVPKGGPTGSRYLS